MCQEYVEAHKLFSQHDGQLFQAGPSSVVHPLFEKGRVQSLVVLVHDSGEIWYSFSHAVIEKNTALAK